MSETKTLKKNSLSGKINAFKAMSGADKRRVLSDLLLNNAMYIIILIAIIFIAFKVPQFLSM